MATQTNAYNSLVGVSGACGTRVVANDSANSAIHTVIQSGHSSSASCPVNRMPKLAPALSAAKVETVRSWIDAGALDN